MDRSNSLAELARRLRAAGRVTILTGAGVSAASGVPTFRGADGLWRHFKPETLATADAFARDPRLVWEWYAWRRELIARCRPNPAHEVIARWSRRPGTVVITQNVDDLHVKADTANLVRLHGSIWALSCFERCPRGITPWLEPEPVPPELPPRCPHCGGHARPAVVWFGEALREADLAAAIAATRCDVFLTVGTSAVVHPAAGLVDVAGRTGAFTAEINAEPTSASGGVQVAIHARAEVALPELDRLVACP